MSLPECEGPANSTLCFLPELLEELQKSETVRFQDFINISPTAFIRDWERWMLWGKTKQKNLKTSKFSTFGTQSILLPIQWWAQVRKFEIFFMNLWLQIFLLLEIESLHCLNQDWFSWFSVGIILNSAVLLIAVRQSKRSDMITRKKWKTTFHLPKKNPTSMSEFTKLLEMIRTQDKLPPKKSKMCANVSVLFSAVT